MIRPRSVDQLNFGSIVSLSSPLILQSSSRWSFQCQLLHLNLIGCFSFGNGVTPKRAKLNPEKVEDLVVKNCNLRLLKTMGFRKKIVTFLIDWFDCLDVDLNHKNAPIVKFFDFPFLYFYLRHFDLLTEGFMSGRLENNRIWGKLLKDLKQPAAKQLARKYPKLGNFEK